MQKCDKYCLFDTNTQYLLYSCNTTLDQTFYLTCYIPVVHIDIFFVSFIYQIVLVLDVCYKCINLQCGLDKVVKQWGISEECAINEEPLNTILGKVKLQENEIKTDQYV